MKSNSSPNLYQEEEDSPRQTGASFSRHKSRAIILDRPIEELDFSAKVNKKVSHLMFKRKRKRNSIN
jgi:hypothetical protein